MPSFDNEELLIIREFERILISEQQNAARNVALLRPHLDVADMLLQMYRILFKSVETAKGQGLTNDDFNFLITLVGACQRQFVVGMDRLLKGHVNDSYHFMRLAVEAACFAYKGFQHPHLIQVWLDSIEGDEEYRDFQNRFSKRFAGNESDLGGLKDVYDECSRYSHANPFGLVGVIPVHENAVQPTYFDGDDEGHLVGAFWTTIDGHWFILAAMLPIFLEFTSKQMTDEGFGHYLMEVHRISAETQGTIGDELRQRVVSTVIH